MLHLQIVEGWGGCGGGGTNMDKRKQPIVGRDGQGAAASQPSGGNSRLSCPWQQESRWLMMDHRAVICGG